MGFEILFRLGQQFHDAVQFLEGHFLPDPHVADQLREPRPAPGQFAQGLVAFLHDGEDLQHGDQAVAGSAVVAEDQMPAGLSAEIQALPEHQVDHVFIAYGSPLHHAARFLDRLVESGVAHDGRHDGVFLERPLAQHVQSGHGEDVVAVDQIPVLVHEQHPVGVAVVRNSQVRPVFPNLPADVSGMHGTALLVDVQTVRMVAVHEHFRSQFPQRTGGGFVSGAVGAIHHDAHPVQGHSARSGRFGVFDIAPQGVFDPNGFADFARAGMNRFDESPEDQFFDPVLDVVIQLVAVRLEEFDAVVVVGIMGGRDHDAGVGPEAPGHVGHSRGRQGADQQHVYPHREQSRSDGVFQHVAGKPRVLADDDLVFVLGAGIQLLEDMGHGFPQLQRRLRRHRFDVGASPHAIGSENPLRFLSHNALLSGPPFGAWNGFPIYHRSFHHGRSLTSAESNPSLPP